MVTHKNFITMKYFSTCLCLRMGTARLLDCATARTTNGRVVKGELLSWLPFLFFYLGCGNWRADACRVFESHIERDWYAVVVNGGVVVRLLSKTVSRILAELHMLSKDIILELTSSFKNICWINFVVSLTHKNFLTRKHFQIKVLQCVCVL